MLRVSFNAWTDWRTKVLSLATPDVYFAQGEGYFQCAVITPAGVGLGFLSDAKPAGLTGFAASFPAATEVDAVAWS